MVTLVTVRRLWTGSVGGGVTVSTGMKHQAVSTAIKSQRSPLKENKEVIYECVCIDIHYPDHSCIDQDVNVYVNLSG